eukprot:Awhi_evm2s4240
MVFEKMKSIKLRDLNPLKGRTPKSCGLLLGYYLCAYIVFVGFFSMMMAIFITTLPSTGAFKLLGLQSPNAVQMAPPRYTNVLRLIVSSPSAASPVVDCKSVNAAACQTATPSTNNIIQINPRVSYDQIGQRILNENVIFKCVPDNDQVTVLTVVPT